MSADVDYETEYNNRARVPENPAIIAGWSREAKAYREAHQARHKVISYGAGERNRIDLFSGDGAGPTSSSSMAAIGRRSMVRSSATSPAGSMPMASMSRCRVTISVPRFPSARSSARCGPRRGLAKLGRPLVVSGHSAGGHLAACMLATDWRAFDASLPAALVTAAYAISGLFDLRPLVSTSINTPLKLDDATARAVSPLFWKSPARGTLDAVVGGNESAEISGRAASSSMPGTRRE